MMKSNSTKKRTASTAIIPKTNLPKIHINNHEEELHDLNRKLFTDNKSMALKSSLKERIKTQLRTERPFISNYKNRFQSFGLRRLEQQLIQVNTLFKKMDKLRQSYGIISINQSGQQQLHYGGEMNQIPYDPNLHQMNEQICLIKGQIEQSLQKVFKISKQYPKLKHMIEDLIEHHLHNFLLQNGRNGKIAAMKAHHRLIQSSRDKVSKLCRL